jgi:hypothetical protein
MMVTFIGKERDDCHKHHERETAQRPAPGSATGAGAARLAA